ncbi:MAG: cytochrome c [Gammaproteobacteria bacterium]|nr:cytochrome c [Gammaproteobacteria bacterium]
MKLSIFVAAFFLLSSLNSFAEKTSEELSSTCLGCHGVVSYNNIYPTYKVPKLGNQHKDYIIAALKAYRSGERSHPTMKAHAVNLNDAEIAKIADYFSSLKTENQNLPSINLEMIDEANSCVGCHGVDGNSMVPTFPKIAGQYEDYLYQALKSYQDGTRNNAIMSGIASTLNEKQMRKLSKYFASHNGLDKINQGRVVLKK